MSVILPDPPAVAADTARDGSSAEPRARRSLLHVARGGPLVFAMLIAVLATAAIWGAVLHQHRGRVQAAIDQEFARNDALVRALAETTRRVLQVADSALLGASQDIVQGIDPQQAVAEAFDRSGLKGDIVTSMRFVGADGRIVAEAIARAAATAERPTRADEREYFLAHAASRDLGLFVSRTYLGRRTSARIVSLSRRIDHPDGRFRGLVHIGLDAGYFGALFLQVTEGTSVAIGLGGMDGKGGTLRVRTTPERQVVYDERIDDQHPIGQAMRGSSPSLRVNAWSPLVDRHMLFAVQRVDGFPLALGATTPEAVAVAAAMSDGHAAMAVAAFATLLLWAGAIAGTLLMSRLARARDALAAAHRESARALDRARLAAQAGGLGFWSWDLVDGRHQVDERYAAMLGLTPQDWGGTARAFYERLHPEDLERLQAHDRACIAGTEGVQDVEFRMRHRDGSWRWILGLGTAIGRDESGRPVTLTGMHRDVTEAHVAREQLEAQRRLLATLSANVPAVLYRLRAEADGLLRFEFVSPDARALFGIPPEALTPARVRGMIAASSPNAYTALRAAIAERRDVIGEIEVEIERPDGERRWVRIDARLVSDDACGATWDGLFLDITSEVAQRSELEAARHAADGASRAKSAFLSGVSHELRTPLTGILGYAQLIELRAGDERSRPLAATIRRSAERMRSLLDEVLDAAKIEAGAMAVTLAPAPLGPLVQESAELFLPAIDGKGLALDVRTGEADEVPALCDAQRVRQVLANLLSNAVKFTADGSITMTLSADDTHVRVRVADTGPGVPADFRGGLFERFRQAHEGVARQHGGTGLGLALSRDFARLMGGELALVDTDPGTGAVFELSLPRAARPDGSSPAGATPAA